MTIRQLISKIRNEMNSISLDDRISNRYIWSKIIDATNVLFRRGSDDRKMFSVTELYTIDDCFKLHSEKANNCTDIIIPECNVYMQSLNIIPLTFSTIYGNPFIVETLNGEILQRTTPTLYKKILKRRFKPLESYYWIHNNKLVIPSFIEVVKISFIKNLSLNLDLCLGMDEEIKIPNWIEYDAVKLVITDLRNRKNIPADENPNNNNNDK